MSIYFSKSSAGFYDSDIHGPRRLAVPDPAWIRPLVTITLQPGEKYQVGDQLVTNDGGVPLVLPDVPDMHAEAPTIEVDNPDCKIPADAVEVTEDERSLLLDGERNGKRIVADAGGRPVLADPEPPTAENVRAAAVAAINATREVDLVSGVVVNGKHYHSDDRFLTELLGMLLGYQAGIYSGTQDIRTMDNQIEALDVAQITALAAAVGAHRKAVYAASWAAKDAL